MCLNDFNATLKTLILGHKSQDDQNHTHLSNLLVYISHTGLHIPLHLFFNPSGIFLFTYCLCLSANVNINILKRSSLKSFFNSCSILMVNLYHNTPPISLYQPLLSERIILGIYILVVCSSTRI